MQLEARLRAFAALARRGSFSGAAEELYVSQPAVSKHLAALETEVGKPLVARGRTGSPLTPAGEVLADYVLRAEALLANARRALATGAEADTGTLSIAASGVPGTYLLPDLLLRFHDRYPGVELDFEVSTSAEALELVRAHRVELAVVGGFETPPELESERLVDDDVVLVGPTSLGGRRLRPKDLEGFTWISRSEGSATRAAVETARWELGVQAARTVELPSWEAVKRAVAKGGGIAAISRLALELELDAGTLVVLDVPQWRVTRTIAVLRAREVPLTPPAERFVELLRGAFASTDEEAPSTLPVPSTRLIGREREVAEVSATIRASTRVVTLTGVGGSGKTRVAVAVATALAPEFADGVFFVDLAPLRDPALVMPTISRALGEPDPEQLGDRLRGRSVLLVLDNVEHLLDAVAEIGKLVRTSHALQVLATSRSPLGLGGERPYPIEPLEPGAASTLFSERAGVEPDATVATICERLEHLPLALELAAARARSLSPEVLAKRLGSRLSLGGGPRDAPERQRTLRATIEWSHNLLDERERGLFAQLGVFVGGWSMEAAEAVCAADIDALASLVEVSLVRRAGERFSMLETVRELAAERLEQRADHDDLRRRHAEHFLEFAVSGRDLARGPQEKEWLDRLELDLDNLRTALAWALERGDAALGLTLADALEPLWIRRKRAREGLAWLVRLLELEGEVDDGVRAGALAVAARVGLRLGERERAASWNRESLALARRAGDELRIAWALHGLGHDARAKGDFARARALFEESFELFERLEQYGPAGGRLTFLGVMATDAGDLAEARSLYQRAAALYGKAEDASGVAGSLLGLGELALRETNTGEALRRYREAFPLVDRMRSASNIVYCLAGIACALVEAGRRADAATLWGAADAIDARGDVRELRDEDRRFYEGRLGPLDGREVESGRALTTDAALSLARELLAAVSSTFPARRRSRLARTVGHSSSSTE